MVSLQVALVHRNDLAYLVAMDDASCRRRSGLVVVLLVVAKFCVVLSVHDISCDVADILRKRLR
jgi:hypothetical protein